MMFIIRVLCFLWINGLVIREFFMSVIYSVILEINLFKDIDWNSF